MITINMGTEVEKKPEIKRYPKIMKSKITGALWLILTDKSGIKLEEGDIDPGYPAGHHHTDLYTDLFEDYNELVTLTIQNT